ncbi:uncharacterized protein LOC135208350 [Macrobrachium nipponense]|uniref:uncharacterized protein LOC135208350 n=1 Tax=Macrobrachium nipponense TaxID=159736 RepID=UPI0030C8259D
MRVIDEKPIPAMAITVCPMPPWSIAKMVQAGLDTSCGTLYACSHTTLYTLQGYIQPSQPFIWNEVKADVEEFIEKVSWAGKVAHKAQWVGNSLASMPCYSWLPEKEFHNTEVDIARLNFTEKFVRDCRNYKFLSCEDFQLDCGMNCTVRLQQYQRDAGDQRFFIMVHASDEKPLPGMLQPAISTSYRNKLTLYVDYEDTMLQNTPKKPCTSPLSHSKCFLSCYLQNSVTTANCSIDLKADKVICPDLNAWRLLRAKEIEALNGNLNWWQSCSHCDRPCQVKVYYVSAAEENGDSHINVRMAAMRHKHTAETRAYTLPNFLADVGGGFGLWLGTCGLSITMAALNLFCRYLRLQNLGCSEQQGKKVTGAALKTEVLGKKSGDQTHLPARPETTGKCTRSCKAKFHSFILGLYLLSARKWTSVILNIIFWICFVIHAYSTASSYFSYPTSTKISLQRNPEDNPRITVCSKIPYSLSSMVELGFNYSESACKRLAVGKNASLALICEIDKVIDPWIKEFDGQSPETILSDIWNETKLPLSLLINDEDSQLRDNTWKPLMTDQNVCYQSTDMIASTLLEFQIESQYKNMNCSYLSPDMTCMWVSYHGTKMSASLMVTSTDYNPILILPDSPDLWAIDPGKNCYRHLPCLEGLDIEYTFRHLLDTPVDPCSSDPEYNQMDCIYTCMLTQLAREEGCVPPYLQDNSLPECTIQDFREGKMAFELQAMTEARDICREKCPTQCKRSFMSVTPYFVTSGKQGSITVRHDVSLHKRTEEELVWPLNRAICEIGGAMGLYLGLSFTSVLQSVTILVMTLASMALSFGRRISKTTRAKDGMAPKQRGGDFYNPKPPPINVMVPEKAMYIPPKTIFSKDEEVSSFPFSEKGAYTLNDKVKQINTRPNLDQRVIPSAWLANEMSSTQKTSFAASENGKWCRDHFWWMMAAIPCAVIFFPLAINQYQAYSAFPVFTSYETRYLEDVIFPSVTFCLWPPFHPHRLASAGVFYNFSHHCTKFYDSEATFKYNCDWEAVFNELLNDLPGNWTGDLQTLWKNVAWKKSDLFRSLNFAWETFDIADSSYDATENQEQNPLRTVVTSLNRCFTFTPPRPKVTPHTELVLKLTLGTMTCEPTNLKAQIMKRVRCYDPTYYWPMDEMFDPKWVEECWSCYIYEFKLNIFVHPPNQMPLLAEDGSYHQVALTSNTFGVRLEVSLDAFDRLSTPSSPCVDARNIPGGTREDYATFPKYFASPGEILQDPLEARRRCEESCPESCTLLHYSTNQGSAKLTEVSIAFQKPMFTQLIVDMSLAANKHYSQRFRETSIPSGVTELGIFRASRPQIYLKEANADIKKYF